MLRLPEVRLLPDWLDPLDWLEPSLWLEAVLRLWPEGLDWLEIELPLEIELILALEPLERLDWLKSCGLTLEALPALPKLTLERLLCVGVLWLERAETELRLLADTVLALDWLVALEPVLWSDCWESLLWLETVLRDWVDRLEGVLMLEGEAEDPELWLEAVLRDWVDRLEGVLTLDWLELELSVLRLEPLLALDWSEKVLELELCSRPHSNPQTWPQNMR